MVAGNKSQLSHFFAKSSQNPGDILSVDDIDRSRFFILRSRDHMTLIWGKRRIPLTPEMIPRVPSSPRSLYLSQFLLLEEEE